MRLAGENYYAEWRGLQVNATDFWRIYCDAPVRGCEKNPDGARYRGVKKCWKCPHATWAEINDDDTRRSYSPKGVKK